MQQTKAVLILASIATLAVLTIGAAGPLMSQVEQPSFTVERAEGRIELRAYPPMIVAEAAVRGDRKDAIRQGFQIIAGYIFGANAGAQKVEMTAPVMQEKSLTGPSDGRLVEQTSGNSWVVRFVMPRRWSLATLPKPKDPRVTLKARPAATFAAIRFSGLAPATAIQQKTQELSDFIAKNKLEPEGAPILAFFDPPWTLPFLRRNEVMIEVKPR